VVGLKAYMQKKQNVQERDVEARQAPTPAAIGQLVTTLLVQVSTALNGIIAGLGLSECFWFLSQVILNNWRDFDDNG